MKLTEKALLDLGYDVVSFRLEDEEWREATDYLMSIIANGSGSAMIKEFEVEGETILTPLWKNG